jgi:hypothetical protein
MVPIDFLYSLMFAGSNATRFPKLLASSEPSHILKYVRIPVHASSVLRENDKTKPEATRPLNIESSNAIRR